MKTAHSYTKTEGVEIIVREYICIFLYTPNSLAFELYSYYFEPARSPIKDSSAKEVRISEMSGS